MKVLLPILLLAACAPKVRALETQLTENQAIIARQQGELDALRAQVSELEEWTRRLVRACQREQTLPTRLDDRREEDRVIIGRADLVALTEGSEAPRLARVVPYRGPDGNIDSLRLSGIRRGSALDALGLKNGDIVHAINGVALTDMSALMEMDVSFDGVTEVKFELTRRGQRKVVLVVIED